MLIEGKLEESAAARRLTLRPASILLVGLCSDRLGCRRRLCLIEQLGGVFGVKAVVDSDELRVHEERALVPLDDILLSKCLHELNGAHGATFDDVGDIAASDIYGLNFLPNDFIAADGLDFAHNHEPIGVGLQESRKSKQPVKLKGLKRRQVNKFDVVMGILQIYHFFTCFFLFYEQISIEIRDFFKNCTPKSNKLQSKESAPRLQSTNVNETPTLPRTAIRFFVDENYKTGNDG